MPNPQLIRPLVRELHPYVYGEQPKIKGLIKLNTNENPYPPSPKVLAAVKAAVDGRLRLYPNPTAERLREKLAKLHGCHADNIIVGNGSDELLALATRCFVEPVSSGVPRSPKHRVSESPCLAVRFNTSRRATRCIRCWRIFTVRPEMRCRSNRISVCRPGGIAKKSAADLGFPRRADVCDHAERAQRARVPDARTRRALQGAARRGGAGRSLRGFCRGKRAEAGVEISARPRGADVFQGVFAVLPAGRLFCRASRPHRGAAQDSRQLQCERPRPDCRRSHAGRFAVLPGEFQKNHRHARMVEPRVDKARFPGLPSRTNFILVRPPRFSAPVWLQSLRVQKVLVRWFDRPEVKDYLRITIGTASEAKVLVNAVRKILV
jgi:histidinol-phosphate aminotransferase